MGLFKLSLIFILSWALLTALLYASCESRSRGLRQAELYDREREDCAFKHHEERSRVMCIRAVDDRQYKANGCNR